MTFLYGDSTASPIGFNYIDFLRQALGLCVEILLAEQRVELSRQRRRTIEDEIASEINRLEELGARVQQVLDQARDEELSLASERCSAVIARAVAEAVNHEMGAVRGDVSGDLDDIAADIERERRAYRATFEKLLMTYNLPQSTSHICLALDYGEYYTGQLRNSTPYGAETSVDLDTSDSEIFARQFRVNQLTDGLSIRTPERRGWIRKQVKMIPTNVAKYYVVEVAVSPSVIAFKLRASAAFSGAGYDVVVDHKQATVTIHHYSSGDAEPRSFAADPADLPALRDFAGQLAAAARRLASRRRALLEIKFDGAPLLTCDKPAALIPSMIEAMAPVVRELSAHSQSSGELVLRRLLSGDRREEIFTRKSDLARILAPLPEDLRRVFAPLELGAVPEDRDEEETAAPADASRSAPAPSMTDEALAPVTGEIAALSEPDLAIAEPAGDDESGTVHVALDDDASSDSQDADSSDDSAADETVTLADSDIVTEQSEPQPARRRTLPPPPRRSSPSLSRHLSPPPPQRLPPPPPPQMRRPPVRHASQAG
ncbi:MAG: hypothetical protein AAGC55_01890 [Myxococcota bacterium]